MNGLGSRLTCWHAQIIQIYHSATNPSGSCALVDCFRKYIHSQLIVLNPVDVHLVSNCVGQGVCNNEIDNIHTYILHY